MSSYDHTILEQVLEVRVSDRAQHEHVQKAFSPHIEHQLNALLDLIFSQHAPDDVVITIEQLKVDLGHLNLATLAQDLTAQIRQKLSPVVQAEVRRVIRDPYKKNVTPLPSAQIKAVEHYLVHGYFAWWMPTATPNAIEALYTKLLQEAPNALQELGFRLRHIPKALKRLVTQFSPTTIQQTLQLFSSTHQEEAIALVSDLLQLQSVVPLSGNNNALNFEQAIWDATLSQFLSPPTAFNVQTFTEASLKHLARTLNTGYQSLIITLAQHLTRTKSSSKLKSRLPVIITQLHESLITPFTPTPSQATLPQLIKQIDDSWPPTDKASNQAIAPLLAKLVTQATPSELKALLAGWLQKEAAITLLTTSLDTAQLISMLQPNLKSTYGLASYLWQQVPSSASSQGASELLTAKTLQYLSKAPPHQSPEHYLQYLLQTPQIQQRLAQAKTLNAQSYAQISQQFTQAAVAQVHQALDTTSNSIPDEAPATWENQLKHYLAQAAVPPAYNNATAFKATI
ncbi:MAG: contractile injection system tape measure protein, partial [Bacteroidota bacterium]